MSVDHKALLNENHISDAELPDHILQSGTVSARIHACESKGCGWYSTLIQTTNARTLQLIRCWNEIVPVMIMHNGLFLPSKQEMLVNRDGFFLVRHVGGHTKLWVGTTNQNEYNVGCCDNSDAIDLKQTPVVCPTPTDVVNALCHFVNDHPKIIRLLFESNPQSVNAKRKACEELGSGSMQTAYTILNTKIYQVRHLWNYLVNAPELAHIEWPTKKWMLSKDPSQVDFQLTTKGNCSIGRLDDGLYYHMLANDSKTVAKYPTIPDLIKGIAAFEKTVVKPVPIVPSVPPVAAIQRKLTTLLSGIEVEYDGTARDGHGSIYQFRWGDDGTDPSAMDVSSSTAVDVPKLGAPSAPLPPARIPRQLSVKTVPVPVLIDTLPPQPNSS